MADVQKDFFEEMREKGGKKKKSFFRSSEHKEISFSSSFDAILLGLLILTMAIVIVYAIGVEVGHQQRLHLAKRSSIKTVITQTVPPPPQRKEPVAGKYTVQIASYITRETADQALEKAKREMKGIDFFLIGTKQFALCAGSYETREAANRALTEFQKRYGDSFVRNR